MAGRQLNPVQHRKNLEIERAAEHERLTRREASMAKAREALQATYAKYGIKPISERPQEKLRHSTVMQAKRKKLTPEQASKLHRWLDRQGKEAHDRDRD